MTSQDLLTLARQGDSNAIAAILNRVTEPKGIKVKVTRQARCLHILLESDKPLSQQSVVNFVLGSIRTLKIEPIETVEVYGRQIGKNSVAWNQGIWLDGSLHQPTAVQPTAAQPAAVQDSVTYVSQPTHPSTPAPVIQSTQPSTVPPIPPSPEQSLMVPDPFLSAPTAPDPAVSASIMPDPLLSASTAPDPAVSAPAEKAIASADTPISLDETALDRTASASGDVAATQDLLRRPEAVVLILFVTLIMLWQLYLDFVEDADVDEPISGRELARRLGVNNSTISRRKDRADFPTWTQDLDPDGIAWIHQNGLFVAQIE